LQVWARRSRVKRLQVTPHKSPLKGGSSYLLVWAWHAEWEASKYSGKQASKFEKLDGFNQFVVIFKFPLWILFH
jgi:hypothetical protein